MTLHNCTYEYGIENVYINMESLEILLKVAK